MSLPHITLSTGIFLMSPDRGKEQATDANKHYSLPQPTQLCQDDARRETYVDLDGIRWLVCATDGAVTDQQRKILCRAGYAVYYGEGHSQNTSAPLHGPSQGAYDAEIEAIKLVTHRTHGQCILVVIDNMAVKDIFQAIILDEYGGSDDRWLEIKRAVAAQKNAGKKFRAEWLPSHFSEERAISEGLNMDYWRLNNGGRQNGPRGRSEPCSIAHRQGGAGQEHEAG